GEDSLLLAAAGFTVIMYERDPVIASLLRDTLIRAAVDPRLSGIVCRMEMREEDSIEAMNRMKTETDSFRPDVVLLDPMFPERQKSGLVKKKFQLLHYLERPCADEEELLQAALEVRPRRIVIKRPAKGPYLAGVKPSYSLRGKTVRYDCVALS
ncbi:MAG: class I SAM-dependent methyltransferase, partial [Parasporobacterium sp.]|nr:class I SAM-dependent methyltransferase [Parasporobacterium sp.]